LVGRARRQGGAGRRQEEEVVGSSTRVEEGGEVLQCVGAAEPEEAQSLELEFSMFSS
jgi:hypothetical protein